MKAKVPDNATKHMKSSRDPRGGVQPAFAELFASNLLKCAGLVRILHHTSVL